MSEGSEFSRLVDRRQIDAAPMRLSADEQERAALAERFGIIAVERLEAEIALAAEGDVVKAEGTVEADIVQSCAISGEDLPATIREPLHLRFVPASGRATPGEEIELASDQLDEIEYTGTAFDLGEAVAETLGLAIDPYATGPAADAVRQKYGLAEQASEGPLAAALARLAKKD